MAKLMPKMIYGQNALGQLMGLPRGPTALWQICLARGGLLRTPYGFGWPSDRSHCPSQPQTAASTASFITFIVLLLLSHNFSSPIQFNYYAIFRSFPLFARRPSFFWPSIPKFFSHISPFYIRFATIPCKFTYLFPSARPLWAFLFRAKVKKQRSLK